MNLKIDNAGRIVVPKSVRERLGFTSDSDLQAVEQQDGLLIRRAETGPSMIKIDGLWVHQGNAETGAKWDKILEIVREDRAESTSRA